MGFNWFKVRTGAENNIQWKMVMLIYLYNKALRLYIFIFSYVSYSWLNGLTELAEFSFEETHGYPGVTKAKNSLYSIFSKTFTDKVGTLLKQINNMIDCCFYFNLKFRIVILYLNICETVQRSKLLILI